VAAGLFAERTYEAVSILDVARAAEVSDQTVYNYFPAKQDLVLDRVDEFLERYRRAVLERGDGDGDGDGASLAPSWRRRASSTPSST
jgi:AcrR family transcriptional regulator